MMKAGAIGRLGDVTKLHGTVSGVCKILSTGEPSLPFPRSPQGRRSGGITSENF